MKFMAFLAAGYIFYCGILFLFQRQVIFPRHLAKTAELPRPPAEVERIWLDTTSGRVEAWYLPAGGDSTRAHMIVGHGNAELIDHIFQDFSVFSRVGIAVLLVEYPGYGRSGGLPSEKSMTSAFALAWDWLVQTKGADPARIVLFGRSLGGGAVCRLAAIRKSGAMILQSTFTSTRSFAKRYLAPGFMVKDPFDNLSVVSSYKRPLLVIHGRFDEVIPFAHGVALSKAAPFGRLIEYPCGHNDCPDDPATFFEDVTGFLVESGIIPDYRKKG